MDDHEVFLFAGYIDTPKDYKGAIGIYPYFWSLGPEVQVKLLESWKRNIEYLLSEDLEDFDIEDEVLIIADEEPVERKKFKDNVVPFKK